MYAEEMSARTLHGTVWVRSVAGARVERDGALRMDSAEVRHA